MRKPWLVIADLEADNSRLAKESIIRQEAEAGNDEFFQGVRVALDSMITFGVKQVPEAVKDGRGLTYSAFWDTAKQLADRKITGNAAQVAIVNLLNKATAQEWNGWYRRILIKDLRCGVSESTANKIWPALIPEYPVMLASGYDDKLVGQMIWPALVQLKLDGMRFNAIVQSGKVEFKRSEEHTSELQSH